MTDNTNTPTDTLDSVISANTDTPVTETNKEPDYKDLETMSDSDIDKLLLGEPTPEPTPAPAAVALPPADYGPSSDEDEDLLPEIDPKTGQPAMVPIGRLNQEIRKRKAESAKRQEAERGLAYNAGKVDGLTDKTAPSKPEISEEAIRNDISKLESNLINATDALAKKFDDGEITLTEFRKQERQLTHSAEKLRSGLNNLLEDTARKKRTPAPATVEQNLKSYAPLQAKTEELVAQNPWVNNLNQTQIQRLTDQAAAELERQGITLPALDEPFERHVEYTLDLRIALMEVGKQLGLDKIGQPSPTPATASPANPNTLKDKLALSRQQPPVPTTSGTNLPVDAIAGISEEISFDDLANLPDAQLDAMLDRELRKQA